MVLETIITRRLHVRPLEDGSGDWEVGTDADGWYIGQTPQEALWAWATDHAPEILPDTEVPEEG